MSARPSPASRGDLPADVRELLVSAFARMLIEEIEAERRGEVGGTVGSRSGLDQLRTPTSDATRHRRRGRDPGGPPTWAIVAR
jgi:hypothetical protein